MTWTTNLVHQAWQNKCEAMKLHTHAHTLQTERVSVEWGALNSTDRTSGGSRVSWKRLRFPFKWAGMRDHLQQKKKKQHCKSDPWVKGRVKVTLPQRYTNLKMSCAQWYNSSRENRKARINAACRPSSLSSSAMKSKMDGYYYIDHSSICIKKHICIIIIVNIEKSSHSSGT